MMIVVRKDKRSRLRERFKCSEGYVSLSLHFKTNSLKARQVRSYAVNNLKGVLV